MYRILVLSFVIGCVGLVGCSGEAPKCKLSGTVSLDGQPLAKGTIRFLPTDGKTAAALGSGSIEGGQFTAMVPLGDMKVEINAPKVLGKKKMYDTPDSPTVDDVAELIPDKYNVKSDLKINVKGSEQKETFDLKSK